MSKLFSLIYQGDVHTTDDQKIIPAAAFTTLVEAEEILKKAREDADRLKKETEEACKTLRETAQKEGYQEGLTQLNEKILAFDQERKQLRHELNKLILPLALKAAKKIVAKELETHPETIVDIVLKILNPVLENHTIIIWVNKADKEILEAHKPLLKEKLERVEALIIKDRDDITPGGCIIQTESGMINATAESQWDALKNAFDRYLKSSIIS